MDALPRPQDPTARSKAPHPATVACTCQVRQPNRYRVEKPTGGTRTPTRPWVCQDRATPAQLEAATFPTIQSAHMHAEKLALDASIHLIETTLQDWTRWVDERHAKHGLSDAPANAMGLCIAALTQALEREGIDPSDRLSIHGLARVLAGHSRIGERAPRCGGCAWRPGREGVDGHLAHQGAMVLVHVLHTDQIDVPLALPPSPLVGTARS